MVTGAALLATERAATSEGLMLTFGCPVWTDYLVYGIRAASSKTIKAVNVR